MTSAEVQPSRRLDFPWSRELRGGPESTGLWSGDLLKVGRGADRSWVEEPPRGRTLRSHLLLYLILKLILYYL